MPLFIYVPLPIQKSEWYLLASGYLFCLFRRFFFWILELLPQCDIFCYHFIIHFRYQPDVRIESADTISISEVHTLTLKCSFDFGTGLLNVKWIHNYNIEIKFQTLITPSLTLGSAKFEMKLDLDLNLSI